MLFSDQGSTLGIILFIDGIERDCLSLLGRLARLPLRPPILAVCAQRHKELLPTLLEAGVDTALFDVVNDIPIAAWCARVATNLSRFLIGPGLFAATPRNPRSADFVACRPIRGIVPRDRAKPVRSTACLRQDNPVGPNHLPNHERTDSRLRDRVVLLPDNVCLAGASAPAARSAYGRRLRPRQLPGRTRSISEHKQGRLLPELN